MRKARRYFWTSAILLTVMASTFLLVPMASDLSTDETRMPLVLTGGAFWGGFIGGYFCYFLAVKNYKKARERYDLRENRLRIPYVLSNIPTVIADVLFIVSALGMLYLVVVHKTNSYFMFIWIFGLIWSIQMHVLFCGKLYNFIKRKRDGQK